MMRVTITRLLCGGTLTLSASVAFAQTDSTNPRSTQPVPGASAVAGGYQASDETASNKCLVCHAEQREAATVGVHSENGVRCVECHGGDASARALPAAHGKGFTGKLSKIAVAQLCGSCHSDPNKMRGYGLATGQLAEFRTSRHGQLLFGKNDGDAPTCTNCHGTHIIYPPYDARSPVYATNIPTTCARCHADEKLMQKYDLPTDQFEQYRNSAHGKTLFEKQDFAAPTCVSCHGAHSALPPKRTEVASVCGTCHQLVAQAFNAGPHGPAARSGRIQGCLGCHRNHGTQRIANDSIAAMCDKCHATDTRLHQMGVDLQRRMTQATSDLRSAASAVDRLAKAGQRMGDARFRYQSTLSDYLQIAQVQHGLDPDKLETLEGRVSAGSIELDRMAAASDDTRFEHKLLLLPVWFLSLSAVALAGLTLRALRPGVGGGES